MDGLFNNQLKPDKNPNLSKSDKLTQKSDTVSLLIKSIKVHLISLKWP